jgi:biopolymer transport protein ExbD
MRLSYHGWTKTGVKWPNRIHSRVDATRDGKIYFRNVPISAKNLPDKIREGLKNGAEKKVYLRADARARYGDVKQALIEIRQTGIDNVCFLAEKLQP